MKIFFQNSVHKWFWQHHIILKMVFFEKKWSPYSKFWLIIDSYLFHIDQPIDNMEFANFQYLKLLILIFKFLVGFLHFSTLPSQVCCICEPKYLHNRAGYLNSIKSFHISRFETLFWSYHAKITPDPLIALILFLTLNFVKPQIKVFLGHKIILKWWPYNIFIYSKSDSL